MQHLINQLKDLRKSKKIKTTELCEAIGISRAALWRIENYKTSTNIDTIFKYADYLGFKLTLTLK